MIHQIFTVYDAATEAFLQPFFAPTVGAALRIFGEACDDPNHQFVKHAGDYTLFHIGVYDDASAAIDALMAPLKLGSALELRSAAEPSNERSN